MELIPAIDLLGGRVVRLIEGDFGRRTGYSDDPIETAGRWAAEGAARLHLVDLDGARAGRPEQAATVRRIVDSVAIPCQVAGGLRERDAVASALDAGADRVVLGTVLLRDPARGAGLVRDFGSERIVAAIDVRDGRAMGEGWRRGSASVPIVDAVRGLRGAGVVRFAVTAIERDGNLAGPDLDLLGLVRSEAPDVAIIASGGITSLDDLRALADLGMEGAILGRSLYEGRLSLADALVVAAGGRIPS